jgi:hypothetical protein
VVVATPVRQLRHLGFDPPPLAEVGHSGLTLIVEVYISLASEGGRYLTERKFSTNSATTLFCLSPLLEIFVVRQAGQTSSVLRLRRIHSEQKVCRQEVITGAV